MAPLANSAEFRYGFEKTDKGNDLVIWLNKTIDLNPLEDHRVGISVIPNGTK